MKVTQPIDPLRRRLMDSKFLADVAVEILSARALFPDSRHMLAALFEEAGEVAEALMEHDYYTENSNNPASKREVNAAKVYKECVQAAAMAMRVAVEGDPSFSYANPFYIKSNP